MADVSLAQARSLAKTGTQKIRRSALAGTVKGLKGLEEKFGIGHEAVVRLEVEAKLISFASELEVLSDMANATKTWDEGTFLCWFKKWETQREVSKDQG